MICAINSIVALLVLKVNLRGNRKRKFDAIIQDSLPALKGSRRAKTIKKTQTKHAKTTKGLEEAALGGII